MNDPKISVIIPVYNVEQYLDECIQSLQSQTYRNFEAIFVNDGSTDNSLEILERYAAEDTRLKVFSKKNEGLSATRNVALEKVNGNYIFLLDSDDFISPDLFESAMHQFSKDSQIDAVMCEQIQYIDKHQQSVYPVKIDSETISGEEALIKTIDWSIHAQMIFKSDVFRDIRYDTTINYGDEVTKRLIISRCKKISFCVGQYFYRYNPASLTKKVSVKFFDYGRSYLKVRDILKSRYLYERSQDIIEPKLLNILKNLDYYYKNHSNELNSEEKKYAKQSIKELFYDINISYLRKYFRKNRSLFSYMFFCLKTSSYFSYKLFSYLLFPLVKKDYV